MALPYQNPILPLKSHLLYRLLKNYGNVFITRASQVMLVVKNPSASAGDINRSGFNAWVKKIPWRKAWQHTPVFLPRESHGQRSLVGYSPCSLRVRYYWSNLACTHTHTLQNLPSLSVCSPVLLYVFTLLSNQSPKYCSSCKIEILYSVGDNSSLSLPSTLWQQPFYFSVFWFWLL